MGIIWKKVDGFDDRYEVSDTGIIRTKDRKLQIKYWSNGNALFAQLVCAGGFYKKSIQVKRVVWNTFNGKTETGHCNIIKNIDGDIYNNNIINLSIECYKNNLPQYSLKDEIWRDIKEYEGIYQISNLGRIKSCDRKINIQGTAHFYGSKILVCGITKQNYVTCKLCKNGKSKSYSIHALVYDHFGAEKRDGKYRQIDHIDNNPSNNNIDNLQLTSARENIGKKHQNNRFTSKYPGVYRKKNSEKWIANIKINGKRKYLGAFNTEIEASNAYDQANERVINEIKK